MRGALACETVARERFDGDAARRAVVAPPARFAVAPAAAPPLCGVTAFEELFGLVAARADGRDADEEGRAEEDCAVAEEDDRTVPFGRETRFEGMTMRRSARAAHGAPRCSDARRRAYASPWALELSEAASLRCLSSAARARAAATV